MGGSPITRRIGLAAAQHNARAKEKLWRAGNGLEQGARLIPRVNAEPAKMISTVPHVIGFRTESELRSIAHAARTDGRPPPQIAIAKRRSLANIDLISTGRSFGPDRRDFRR